ncbi:hypothetical protein L873DRAFT_1667298 [Choiromyces venosus 120613-1]|uniref:Multicopper oxidase n=1 Tax=Choiromyces venosus 120613-1 TaxID=1336337 RepID=A0A3N4K0P6_9PEZI|nr:hypothetical protein L873DRAFT_1667298 [Choiromyces venosus 120613-1]
MAVYQKLPTSEGKDVTTPQLTKLANVLRALLYTLGLISLAFILSVFLLGGLPAFETLRGSGFHLEKSFRRDPSDYVLGSGWDVHAAPTTRSYNWTISEIEAAPDGILRTLIVIDGQFPGPLVECNEGDTIVIDVYNGATNSTSLHWHGQSQNGTNWMDGTTGVTNCPIPPGKSFRYEFTVREQWGTYWYHAHFSTSRIDGLFGPFIIHSPKENIQSDTDRIVMVHDYYHDLSAALLPQYLAPDNENDEPVPDGALINGMGICSTCEPSSGKLATFGLDRDKTHRLRFINVGAFAEFDVEIDQHELSLVEVDGVEVEPYNLHRFRINVAQRYSVILHANHAADSYWLRARMIAHCFPEIPEDLEPEVLGIIRYSSSEEQPATKGWGEAMELECKDLNTSEVIPAVAMSAPEPDVLIYLRSNFEIGAYRLSRGFFNKTSWRPAEVPTLVEAVDGLAKANKSFSPEGILPAYDINRQMVYRVDGIKTVDLLIDNFDDGNHPFHLHGYKFWVLGQGRGYFDKSTYPSLNTTNPLRRDTVTIEAYGWVLIRFVADNPGMWAFHCHIAWHLEAGMLMQFLTRPDIVAGWKVPEDVKGFCDHPEDQRGGGIPDEDFYELAKRPVGGG